MKNSYILLVLILIIIILATPSTTILTPLVAETRYVTPITITERSGSTLYNYSVRIELNSSNWDGWSYVSSDGSDIYFTDSGGNPLYYWIEEFNYTSQHAIIWVKIPEISADSNATIYLYYGGNNPYSTYSNPDKTFIFWDDFLETSLNTSKWNAYNYGSILVNDSILMLQGDGGGTSKTHVESIPSFSGNIEIRVRANVGTDLAYQALFILFYASSGSVFAYANSIGQGYAMRVSSEYYANDMQLYLFSDGTYTVLYTSDDSINTYQYNDYIIRVYNDTIYVWVNDLEYFNVTDTIYRDGCIVLEAYGSTEYRYFDYVIIRNYVKPEPEVTIGSSMLFPFEPVIQHIFPAQITAQTGEAINLSVSISNIGFQSGYVIVRLYDHYGNVRDEENISLASNGSATVFLTAVLLSSDLGTWYWYVKLENETFVYDERNVLVSVLQTMQGTQGATLFVAIPSWNDVILFDSIMAGGLLVFILSILILFNKRLRILFISSLGTIIFSIILMSSRAGVPIGYTVENNTITYIYTQNPYTLLYLAPLGLGMMGIFIFVLRILRSVFRFKGKKTRYAYRGTIRWGR